jgi:DNA polymerase-3 subunit beta
VRVREKEIAFRGYDFPIPQKKTHKKMKFIINGEDLARCVGIAEKGINKVSAFASPITENIKVEARGKEVFFSGTDNDIYIEARCEAEVLIEGKTLVSGKTIALFVKKIEGLNKIEVEEGFDKLVLTDGENKTEFACVVAGGFPILPKVEGEKFCIVKERELKDIIDKTAFCIATEDKRPELKGLMLETDGGELTGVASDGYRMAITKAAAKKTREGRNEMLLTARAANEIGRLLENTDEEIEIVEENGTLKIEKATFCVVARLMKLKFLDYKRVVPPASMLKTEIKLNKTEFHKSIEKAIIFCDMEKDDSKRKFRIDVEQAKIKISVKSERGGSDEWVECELKGAEISCGFNAKYIIDALVKISEDVVKIGFVSPVAPAIIYPLNGDKFQFIVFPIKLV